MATSAPATSGTFIPSLENHFGVQFEESDFHSPGKFDLPRWNNPYIRLSVIKPYIPSDNQDLLNECKRVYIQNCQSVEKLSNSGVLFRLYQDPFNRVFVLLNPKDLVNFSKVSKCCYLATKADVIWEIQLQNCFPNTQTLPKEICTFSPEQQFKIYFKRMNDELKSYTVQFERNNTVIHHLRGSTGFDGVIDQAWQEYQKLGGEDARNEFNNKVTAILNAGGGALEAGMWDALHQTDVGKANRAYMEYNCLNFRLRRLTGDTYDGKTESIDPDSQQGRCMNAIQEVPKAFDDQDKFVKFIQQSEAAKNNSSEYDEVVFPHDPHAPLIWSDSGSSEIADSTTYYAPSTSDTTADCVIS